MAAQTLNNFNSLDSEALSTVGGVAMFGLVQTDILAVIQMDVGIIL